MIKVTTKRVWELIDDKQPNRIHHLQPGTYELERIAEPSGRHKCNWLVLKGTQIGMAEKAWQQWINGCLADREGAPNYGQPIHWDEFEIVIEEDGVLHPPLAECWWRSASAVIDIQQEPITGVWDESVVLGD